MDAKSLPKGIIHIENRPWSLSEMTLAITAIKLSIYRSISTRQPGFVALIYGKIHVGAAKMCMRHIKIEAANMSMCHIKIEVCQPLFLHSEQPALNF